MCLGRATGVTSRTVLTQSAGIGQRERHQVFGFELSQASLQGIAFAKSLAAIGTTTVGDQQRGDRMPAMTLQVGRCAVIAGDDEHVRVQVEDAGDRGIKLFRLLDFGREVAIFTSAVGVFVVHKEEVEILPVLFQQVQLLVQGLRLADDVHPHQACQTFVHWIDGDRRGLEAIDFFIAG